MWQLAFIIHWVFGILAFRGVRWAYVIFVTVGLLYFPLKVSFHFDPHPCERTFTLALALFSLTNYAHIVMFAIFFMMTMQQFRGNYWTAFGWSSAAVLIMGAAIELLEGITGRGHCRLRDLIPDSAGILLGAASLWCWTKFRRTIASPKAERP